VRFCTEFGSAGCGRRTQCRTVWVSRHLKESSHRAQPDSLASGENHTPTVFSIEGPLHSLAIRITGIVVPLREVVKRATKLGPQPVFRHPPTERRSGVRLRLCNLAPQ
jgi:hypothetical protein